MTCVPKAVCSFSTEQMLYEAKNSDEFAFGLRALCKNDYFSPPVHNFCLALSSGDIESFFSTKLIKQFIDSPILSFVFSHLTDWRLSTPLHHIAYDTNSTEAKFGLSSHEFSNLLALLAQNGDINAENVIGSTPLHQAVEQTNTFMVRFLTRLPQINPNANKSYFLNTPLHLSSFIAESDSESLQQRRGQILQQLLAHADIDPNIQNQAGDTAAHYAVNAGNLFALEALANHSKTDLCIQNLNGNTPAHLLIGSDPETIDGKMYEIFLKAAPHCLALHNNQGLNATDMLKLNFEYGLPFYEVDKEMQD